MRRLIFTTAKTLYSGVVKISLLAGSLRIFLWFLWFNSKANCSVSSLFSLYFSVFSVSSVV